MVLKVQVWFIGARITVVFLLLRKGNGIFIASQAMPLCLNEVDAAGKSCFRIPINFLLIALEFGRNGYDCKIWYCKKLHSIS